MSVTAKIWAGIGIYLAVSVVGIWLAREYAIAIHDIERIPDAYIFLFGPFIGAATVHGIFALFFASVTVVPTAIAAWCVENRNIKVALFCFATAIWIALGALLA
jgi:hypothetical protein